MVPKPEYDGNEWTSDYVYIAGYGRLFICEGLFISLDPTNDPTAQPSMEPTNDPTTSPITEFLFDFKMWRYDDDGNLAAKSGYTLVTIPEIQSGPIHDAFLNYMEDRGNQIEALGTWYTSANCLYSGPIGSCSIDLCGSGSTFYAENIYPLCPHQTHTTIDEGLQDLTSGTPADHTIAIYIKTLECEFGLYENSDPGNVASNNGWDILYYSDVQNETSIYRQLWIDYMIGNNYYLEAIGTAYIHSCAIIYGDGYLFLTSDVVNENYIRAVCGGNLIGGASYRLYTWSQYNTLIAPTQSTQFVKGSYLGIGTAHRNAALYKRCGYPTSQPTSSPTIGPTIDPTSNPTIEPTTDPTPAPTEIPTQNPTTPSPTDPDELICGSNDIGPYNDETIQFEVQMSAFEGDIVFDAHNSDFQVQSITASYLNGTEIDSWTDSISDIAELRVFDLPFGVDLYFSLSAQTGITGTYNVQIFCNSDNPTSSPTSDPTIEPSMNPSSQPSIDPTIVPTIDPTIDPTLNPTSNPTVDPTIEPSTDPSSHPTVAPTQKLLGVFIKDRNGTINNWLYRIEAQILNRRPRFLYSEGNIQTILEYINTWTVIIDLNTSDTSTETAYICNKHGKHPPLNEWITFTQTTSNGDRRRLLASTMDLFITPLLTEFPTPFPTINPSSDPTTKPTDEPTSSNPTLAPIIPLQYQQNYTITIGSTSNKSLALNDTEYNQLLQNTINDLLDLNEDDYQIQTTISTSNDNPNLKVIVVIVQSNDEDIITEISAENINAELQKDIIETYPELNVEEFVINVQNNDAVPTTTSIEQDSLKEGETSSGLEIVVIILCFICGCTYLLCLLQKQKQNTESKMSEMVNIRAKANTLEPMTGENITNETNITINLEQVST